MSWFKVDDAFHSSKPVMRIPRRHRLQAVGLWTMAGAWSVLHETNGAVPAYALTYLGGKSSIAKHLVTAGLWSVTENGWRFCNWRKHQDGDYRRNIRASVREEVMRRDGFKCVFCGADKNLSLDHIERYRDGGADTADNLRVLCMPCNQERG